MVMDLEFDGSVKMAPGFPEGCIEAVYDAIKTHCSKGDIIQYPIVRNWTDYRFSPAHTARAIAMFADNIGQDKKTHIAIFRVRI